MIALTRPGAAPTGFLLAGLIALIMLGPYLNVRRAVGSGTTACSAPSFRPAPIYGVGPEARQAVAGDLTGDGKPDIVTADYATNSVSVLLNDGTGTFTGPTHFSSGPGSQSVAIGDFNSDGKADLVTANVNSFTVSLLVGDGAGGFGAPATFNVGAQPFFVVARDFNNDGRLDIAIARSATNTVAVLLGNGAGNFSAPIVSFTSQQPQFLAAGDFNNDGRLDLAVATSNSLQIFTGDGGGNFAYTCGLTAASSVVVGDLNGDGRLDLMSTWRLSNLVSVHLNNGAGCFTTQSFPGSGVPGSHTGPSQIGDLNGDGKLDLLVGTEASLSVFLGDGAGNFSPPVTVASGADVWAIADFNADGKRDALWSLSTTAVGIYFGNGAGGFSNALRGYLTSAVAADFNLDGRRDLAIGGVRGCAVLLSDGAGGFDDSKSFTLGLSLDLLATGDFNNDGKPDLITKTGFSNLVILLGDGMGNFAASINYVTGADPNAIGVGDFNNDGNLDVVTAHSQEGKVCVKLGDGRGGLGPTTSFPVNVIVNITSVCIGDFNSDGNLDLAIPYFGGVTILIGDGQGAFSTGDTAVPGIASQVVVTRDLNGDGKLDLVSANANSADLSVVFGNGAGGFSAPNTIPLNRKAVMLAFGEFNGDSFVDLSVASYSDGGAGLSNVAVLLGNGLGGFQSPSDYPVPFPTAIVAADVTGDGRTDITVPTSIGMLALLVNTCAAIPPPTTTLQFGSPGYQAGEGTGGALLTVVRGGDISGTSTVDFATSDGSAVQNQDYTVEAGTLRFHPGDINKIVRIPIVDDAYPESSETLTLTLSHGTGATLGATNPATVTITDNDGSGPSIPQKRFMAALEAAQEIPPSITCPPPPAICPTGSGMVLLNSSETSALVGLQFFDLTSPETAAHIHTQAIGVAGPITFPLAPPITNPITDLQINPTAPQVANLKAGQQYMNVHSSNFPGGEIRGQLLWNPTLEMPFFIRQHYLDFLNREPDAGGLAFWLSQINCPPPTPGNPPYDQANVQCFHDRTVGVSDQFFFSGEFHLTASFVFKAYRATYGNTQPFPNPDAGPEAKKLPDYNVFMNDRPRVLGGANLEQAQLAFTNLFVSRPEFASRYGAGLNTGALFVDAVLANIQTADGVVFSSTDRQTLIDHYNNAGGGNAGRARVMWHLSNDYWNTCSGAAPCVPAGFTPAVDNRAFIDAEYNREFALTLYFGYLRRNPEIPGFLFWQDAINQAPVRNQARQIGLVCSFVTSGEYQARFGPYPAFGNGFLFPRSNAECR